MALGDQRGSLCKKFNLVGARLASYMSTETESDGRPFSRHLASMSKFTSTVPAAGVPAESNKAQQQKPASTIARAFKV